MQGFIFTEQRKKEQNVSAVLTAKAAPETAADAEAILTAVAPADAAVQLQRIIKADIIFVYIKTHPFYAVLSQSVCGCV